MDATEWVIAYADRIGVDAPDSATIEAILELAASAAHASERTAAPVACYLAAMARLSLDEALRIATEIESED